MRACLRLLRYVKISTASDETGSGTPTTARQFTLANLLRDELISLGISAEVDEHCYVYASLPATPGLEGRPTVGFIAHLDTAPDFPGEGVSPRIIEGYDGGDVPLGESGRVLSVRDFPHLPSLAGRTLIVTDGTTLLGADDKAGIAEIMTLLEEILSQGLPHGPIAVCFTPDEEVGAGTACFDIARFGADFAYTLDGGREGEVVWENFNAAEAKWVIRGVNVHPGEAKGIMVNASLVAMEIHSALPAGETPATTTGREGFYHLTDMTGDVAGATLHYILRDHDADRFEERKEVMRKICAGMKAKYGDGAVTLTLREQYRNMEEKMRDDPRPVELALAATRALGMEPDTTPIRGGTDGASLTWRGLPTPNLGTGGHAFHGPYEHITAEGMDIAVAVISGIVALIAAGEGTK